MKQEGTRNPPEPENELSCRVAESVTQGKHELCVLTVRCFKHDQTLQLATVSLRFVTLLEIYLPYQNHTYPSMSIR
jgi:flavin reductase (DIM6/NTAB) family NADH-FMN oxidoreductase RutF